MEFKASQIAQAVNGQIVGSPDTIVTGFSKIEEARQGDITFLSNTKYTHCIYSTRASVVLVRRDFEPSMPVAATLIKVDDPYATLSTLLDIVTQTMAQCPRGIEQPSFIAEGVSIPDDAYVGAFAYIGKRVSIASGVKIYPQVFIGNDVAIGDGTIIYPGVKIYHGCRIGKNCIIHAGAVIGADGFGFAPLPDGTYHKIPQIGIVTIEDDVEIGANTTIDRATMGSTIIRRGAKLDNLIMAAHNTEVGHDTVIAAQTGIAGSTKLGANCMIGGQVGFAGHIHVGDRVHIGAQSGIPADIPDDRRVMGYPAGDAKDFMRQAVYIKRLGDLFDRVKTLEKTIKDNNQEKPII